MVKFLTLSLLFAGMKCSHCSKEQGFVGRKGRWTAMDSSARVSIGWFGDYLLVVGVCVCGGDGTTSRSVLYSSE